MHDQSFGRHAPHMRASEDDSQVDLLLFAFILLLMVLGAVIGWVARAWWGA